MLCTHTLFLCKTKLFSRIPSCISQPSSIRAERTELLPLGCRSHNVHTSLGADIYGSRHLQQIKLLEEEFFSSDKGFSTTGFPSRVLDVTGSTFPIHLSQFGHFSSTLQVQLLKHSVFAQHCPPAPMAWENGAKCNTECLIQTEKLGGKKKKKEGEFTPLGNHLL